MSSGDQIWYVVIGSQRHGPYTVQELWHWFEQGRLSLDHLCVSDTSNTPVPLRQILSQPATAPAPVSSSREVPPTEQAPSRSASPPADPAALLSAAPQPNALNRGIRMMRHITWVMAVLLFGVVVAFGMWRWMLVKRGDRPSKPRTMQAPPRNQPAKTTGSDEMDPQTKADVEALFQEAATALGEARFEDAKANWEKILERTGNKPAFASETEAAKRWLDWLDLTQHPGKRFVVQGATAGMNTVVKIFDRRDETTYHVRVGGTFLEFRLDRYDEKTHTADISTNGQSFTIEGKPKR